MITIKWTSYNNVGKTNDRVFTLYYFEYTNRSKYIIPNRTNINTICYLLHIFILAIWTVQPSMSYIIYAYVNDRNNM